MDFSTVNKLGNGFNWQGKQEDLKPYIEYCAENGFNPYVPCKEEEALALAIDGYCLKGLKLSYKTYTIEQGKTKKMGVISEVSNINLSKEWIETVESSICTVDSGVFDWVKSNSILKQIKLMTLEECHKKRVKLLSEMQNGVLKVKTEDLNKRLSIAISEYQEKNIHSGLCDCFLALSGVEKSGWSWLVDYEYPTTKQVNLEVIKQLTTV